MVFYFQDEVILSGAELFWDIVYMIYTLQPVKGCYQSTSTNCPVIWNVQYSYKTGTRITRRMVRIGKANVAQCLQKMWPEIYINKTL